MHVAYNVSAIKMYLLDRFIRDVSGGQKDVTAFVRSLWNIAEEFTEPRQVSDEQVVAALASVVGVEKSGYLRQLAAGVQFKAGDFKPLVPAFCEYADWLAQSHFDGSRLRFLLYLDIVSAKGENWPHWCTYPQDLEYAATYLLRDFDSYLKTLRKPAPDKTDVLAALKAATGKDHAGLFEFWEGWGMTLDPASAVVLAPAPATSPVTPPPSSPTTVPPTQETAPSPQGSSQTVTVAAILGVIAVGVLAARYANRRTKG